MMMSHNDEPSSSQVMKIHTVFRQEQQYSLGLHFKTCSNFSKV